MFAGALIVGAINGILIRFANFTAIAATLAMYIGLQGMSFLLRDSPDGYINMRVVEIVTWQWGPIPARLHRAGGDRPGLRIRVAQVAGRLAASGRSVQMRIRRGGLAFAIDRTFVAGYIACSLLTAIGAVMLMTQIGVGDPRQGINYTLSSITAVVLGGTSLQRRAWHVHRHRAGCGAADGSPQCRDLHRPLADLPIYIPGRTHRRVGLDLCDSPQTRRVICRPATERAAVVNGIGSS